MGIGDNIMASGMARGAKARGKRVAFGDGSRIIWDQNSHSIFAGNPNIASPGQEAAGDLEWVKYYKGHRIYNAQGNGRWIWNEAFRPVPGEIYLTPREIRDGRRCQSGFVLMEPNVETWKSVAPNKDWGFSRYQVIADRLRGKGFRVVQFRYGSNRQVLRHADVVITRSFRDAFSIMRNARLYIGPEGGLHHAAAAAGIPAVVLFGGFIPPSVTGYSTHTNLTGGAVACGNYNPCQHCVDALAAIGEDEVLRAALQHLKVAA